MTTVVHPGDSLSFRRRLLYIIVLGLLSALGPFTIDMYLPAFPVIQDEFGVGPTAIQLTLTATTVGFALGQLLVGPWSDRVGRRTPLIVATSVHIVASLGIIIAPDVYWLGGLRLVQGMGAAASIVVAAAVVRDLFGGIPMVKMLSRLALMSALGPVIAPVVGSQLLRFTEWEGIFVFLLIYGFLMLLGAVFLVKETLPPARRSDPGHVTVRDRYRALFTDHVFIGVAIVGSMTLGGLFSYISSSSILFQENYGLNAQQYGLLFAVLAFGIILGNQTSSRLARRFGPQWILGFTTASQLTFATLIVIVDSLQLGLYAVLVPLFFFIMSCSFSMPLVQVLGLAHHPREAATAASVLGAANFAGAGLISPIAGLFGLHNAVPLGFVMMCTATVGILALWLIVRPKTVPPLIR